MTTTPTNANTTTDKNISNNETKPTMTEDENGYVVLFKDDNLLKFTAYVRGPRDTLYMHKFVKLKFEIPRDYPLTPPKVTFIQHSGGRIHPNLYTEGKVCLSILGTWEGEPWATAMTCETVMITIRSLLDNAPYKHEPHQKDSVSYNDYVRYTTWKWLLLDYLRNETEPELRAYLRNYVVQHGDEMLAELERQQAEAKLRGLGNQVVSHYGGRGNGSVVVNYAALKKDLIAAIELCKAEAAEEKKGDVGTSKTGVKDTKVVGSVVEVVEIDEAVA